MAFLFKSNKAPGIYGINVEGLWRNYVSIYQVLLYVLNGFIESGRIPDDLKIALVRPLFKGEGQSKVDNYRPISILPFIVEI